MPVSPQIHMLTPVCQMTPKMTIWRQITEIMGVKQSYGGEPPILQDGCPRKERNRGRRMAQQLSHHLGCRRPTPEHVVWVPTLPLPIQLLGVAECGSST